MIEKFVIRAYSKKELALMYFPSATNAHTAVNHLMSWVKRNTALTEALAQLGYKKSDKWFTARQMALIIEYLGEP